ncbi:FecCD family ABC transporter permease [Streptomyces sp. NPDC091279]|uniref:FecCD family ABC transporter permease n=1 Tax=unclassified Streptomyces TaxID=2593676 RepID=UPI0038190558
MTSPHRTAPRRQIVRIGGSVTLLTRPRVLWIGVALAALTLLTAVVTLTTGRLGIALTELPNALFGGATGVEAFVLDRLRGPRLSVAVAAGAALGLSGALFQSVTRNPLGSPDVIGVGPGAGAGAALVALFLPPGVPVVLGALVGAGAAVLLVYVSTGAGFRNPGRMVVAGIAIAAMATALTQYVVYAVERDQATVLSSYLNGSLTARSWDDARVIWLVLLVAVPAAVLLARPLALSEMGDTTAEALGVSPRRTRGRSIVLSVLLSAGAVAAAGPIAFIALTAPQIARRLTGASGPHLTLSALTGAWLLPLADLAAQRSPFLADLPVGIWTLGIGGLYLGSLLLREWRKGAL